MYYNQRNFLFLFWNKEYFLYQQKDKNNWNFIKDQNFEETKYGGFTGVNPP